VVDAGREVLDEREDAVVVDLAVKVDLSEGGADAGERVGADGRLARVVLGWGSVGHGGRRLRGGLERGVERLEAGRERVVEDHLFPRLGRLEEEIDQSTRTRSPAPTEVDERFGIQRTASPISPGGTARMSFCTKKPSSRGVAGRATEAKRSSAA
jgi:hypothetical protein